MNYVWNYVNNGDLKSLYNLLLNTLMDSHIIMFSYLGLLYMKYSIGPHLTISLIKRDSATIASVLILQSCAMNAFIDTFCQNQFHYDICWYKTCYQKW